MQMPGPRTRAIPTWLRLEHQALQTAPGKSFHVGEQCDTRLEIIRVVF